MIVEENPLENFKVLYATGAERYMPETGERRRVGGVRYTVKDGIVYDAKGLMAEVRWRVREAKMTQATGAAEERR